MRTHAYVWYDTADRGYGRRLSAYLMDNGVRQWWDRRENPPEQPDETVERMVASCGALVLVISRQTVNSPMAAELVALATGARKPIIAVVRERVVVPPSFQDVQCELMKRDRLPDLRLVDQLKDWTGFYLPADEDDRLGPPSFTGRVRRPLRRALVPAAPSRSARAATAARPQPVRSPANRAVGIVVVVAVLACVAWQPSLAAAAVRFVGSFIYGIVQFFRALFG
jgi:hypothetical protein